MDLGIATSSDTSEDKNGGGLIHGDCTGDFWVNLFGASGEDQMQTAVRRRLTVFVAVLTYSCKALSTEGLGVVHCPVYGPHSRVSSWFTNKDTLFHSRHPQFSQCCLSGEEIFMAAAQSPQIRWLKKESRTAH